MKKYAYLILLLLVAAFLVAACSGSATPEAPTEAPAVEPTAESAEESATHTTPAAAALPPEWDQLLNEWISPDSAFCDAPGGVLLVDSPDGRFVQAAGVASLDDQRPLAINDRFEIGSITKSFTAVLALQLQEEGMLSMDDPLSKWLPDLAASIPNGEQMTLRQIAQHQAGLADYEEPLIDTPLAEGDLSVLEREYTAAELVQWVIENQEPPFTPGEAGQFQYSNTGYLLLGMVLEAATGETEADLLQERIFGPLAMENTIYLEDSPEPGTIVSGYSTIDSGEQIDVTNWNAVQAGAAGAIASTVEDLALYSHALLAGELFNEEATLEEMLTLAPADSDPFVEYGLGVGSLGSPVVPNIGHAGGTPGFQTSWFYVPEAETTIIFFTNSSSCFAGFLPMLLQPEIFGLDAVAPPAAPEPTAEPTAESTEAASETAASETVVEAGLAELTALVEHPWQWVSFLDQAAGPSDIVDPQSYTIAFQSDGTVNIKADCNMVNGAYTVEGDSLTIELGPSTMAACPPESLSDQYLAYLAGAAKYRLEEGQLHIDLMADGGTMSFDPADELGVPPPVEEITALRTTPWQWASFTNPVEQFEVENPERYVASFNDDGTINVIADCNNASGSYVVDSSSLTIQIGPMTLAACPEDSLSDQFVQLLAGAAIYFFEDGELLIDLFADGGTMAFSPALEAEQIASEAEGSVSGTLPEDLVGQLDAYLQSQVYTEGGNPKTAAPGLVLYVETPDGRYLQAVGVSNLEDGTPIQVDDILQIGSNTKSMVIVLLMQLVEEGVLNLDDTLSQWLPEQAAIVPNSDQITIRQMAMHTAGIHDYEEGIITQGLADPTKLQADYTPAEIVQFAMDDGAPDFIPGEEWQWKYSNTGYILLGMLIEAATGESLSDLLQSRIFDPLGLESAVLIEGVPQEGEITTMGYKWTEVGKRLDTTNWNGSQGWAAGSVAMTAEDLAKYGQALAAGEFFQNPDTLTEMLMFNPDALDSGFPYSMGLIDFVGDGTVWGHEGATPGFQSLWYTDPEDGIMVVGLTNSGDYSAFAFLNVLNILEGNGAQPFGPITLLPVGQYFGTIWSWEQFITPTGADDIDEAAGLVILISRDGSVTVSSTDCDQVIGTYSSSGMGNISFDIDASSLTCAADTQAGKFVQYLNDATSWSFNNGRLLIGLPADSGTMVFKYVSFE